VEHYQNSNTKETGDWFKLACQFYFTAYFTDDGHGFYPWILLDWAQVVIGTLNKDICWETKSNNRDNARADFKYCRMDKFPKCCVIASSL
jgi:hypothetical protein